MQPETPPMSIRTPTFALVASLVATPIHAQQQADPHADAAAALAQCIAAAQGGREVEAKSAADRAETLYTAWMRAAPADPNPRVGLANADTRCRIPFAEMMQKGELVNLANGLLEDALRIDSTHWEARFSLAM